MATYTYPLDLHNGNANSLLISAYKKGDPNPVGSVALYCPSGLSFADGAGYSTFDMGAMGGKIVEALGRGADQGNITGALKGAITGQLEGLKGNVGTDMKAMIAAKIASQAALVPGIDSGNLQQAYSATRGVVMNPNTTVAFQNMTIRSFAFSFKLIAESPEETASIKGIQDFFRNEMYPQKSDSTGYILKYPSTFRLRFLKGNGGINEYIPKIYESYLTNMTTTLNPSSHLTHADGSPTEIDFQLTFQETRVLTRDDIAAEELRSTV